MHSSRGDMQCVARLRGWNCKALDQKASQGFGLCGLVEQGNPAQDLEPFRSSGWIAISTLIQCELRCDDRVMIGCGGPLISGDLLSPRNLRIRMKSPRNVPDDSGFKVNDVHD